MRRVLAVSIGLLATCVAEQARADEPLRGAGAVGGGLLAFEATLLGEAAAGVKPDWVYWAGACAAAVAGAYVGSRIEHATNPDVSRGMLGAGVVFVLPAFVWSGNWRTERPAPSSR